MRTWSAWSINTWGLKGQPQKAKMTTYVAREKEVVLSANKQMYHFACVCPCASGLALFICLNMLALLCWCLHLLALLCWCLHFYMLACLCWYLRFSYACVTRVNSSQLIDFSNHGQHDALLSVDYFTLKSLLGELSCFNSLQFWYGDYDAGSKLCWKSWHR